VANESEKRQKREKKIVVLTMATLFSKSFIYTLREIPKIAECRSLELLLKGGFLTMISSGMYAYLPLGVRVLNNINKVIRKYMNQAGAEELLMTALQPIELWQKTGRDKDLQEVMFRFQDRRARKLCLGPTHEEEITEIARRFLFSHKQLPVILYQIQVKFRDEPRPRFGLMRSCEFIMKDAYSFDKDEHGLQESYARMLEAYKKIFKDCGLAVVMTEAESGAMGGSVSHEFMVPASIGEDTLFYCEKDNNYYTSFQPCPRCKGKLIETTMVELGHIFQLGTKYSLAQDAYFLDENGSRKPFIMGCYGIGVSRVLSAIAEVSSDAKGIIWPKGISPFDVNLVMLGEDFIGEAVQLADTLESQGFSVLIDDRQEAAGVKFNDAALIGNPYTVIMGKKYARDKTVDVEVRASGLSVNMAPKAVIQFLNDEYGR